MCNLDLERIARSVGGTYKRAFSDLYGDIIEYIEFRNKQNDITAKYVRLANGYESIWSYGQDLNESAVNREISLNKIRCLRMN
ncbi:MAG: hypothetical protein HY831_04575 [Candidatus Aenigmarchaeota archaeon]|nr:hypothetical protein [Candidatus Aenigmarchaeota archaeon]